MFEHLSIWRGSEHYNYYLIKFSGKSIVRIISTDGQDMCVNTIKAQHNVEEFMFAIREHEFKKVLMFEGSDMSFNFQDNRLYIHGLEINYMKDINKIPAVESIDHLLYTPSVEEDSESSIIAMEQLNKVHKYAHAVGSKNFRINTFQDKPVVIQDYSKMWKILLGCNNA